MTQAMVLWWLADRLTWVRPRPGAPSALKHVVECLCSKNVSPVGTVPGCHSRQTGWHPQPAHWWAVSGSRLKELRSVFLVADSCAAAAEDTVGPGGSQLQHRPVCADLALATRRRSVHRLLTGPLSSCRTSCLNVLTLGRFSSASDLPVCAVNAPWVSEWTSEPSSPRYILGPSFHEFSPNQVLVSLEFGWVMIPDFEQSRVAKWSF